MKLVVFGLTVSSSWGNGHATLWRGLCRALAQLGCRVLFFERDVPYYARMRDLRTLPGGELVLYGDWRAAHARARRELADADAAIVTSYCPDALSARDAVLDADVPAVFYDLDSPVTLARLAAGEPVPYLDARGLADYDLVLSYAGGGALDALRTQLGARRVRPLYGHVDPDVHRPVDVDPRLRADLSWLGTYAADRQAALEELLVRPARRRPARKFLIAGAQYPADFPWAPNIHYMEHLPPQDHAALLCSSRLTLNITRAPMRAMGWCPSGRLFEAAACGATLLSDDWPGLSSFYRPDSELLVAHAADDVLAALERDDRALRDIGRAACERTLDEHTSHHRALELLRHLDAARREPADTVAAARRPSAAEPAQALER